MSKEEKESKAKVRVFSFNVHRQGLAQLKEGLTWFLFWCDFGVPCTLLYSLVLRSSVSVFFSRKSTWDFLPGLFLRGCLSVGSLSAENVWTLKNICSSPLLPCCSIFLNQSSFIYSHIATQHNFWQISLCLHWKWHYKI